VSGAILVLGGTGLLGRAVASVLTRRNRPFEAPGRSSFELMDANGIPSRLDAFAPSAVINLSGFTDVAAAERPENRAVASALNADVPEALAWLCSRRTIPFVHVSTDYVFDGAKGAPYVEDDPVHPIQVYGATKLEGEQRALAADPSVLIARVSTLYGPDRPQRPAYVDAILAQARTAAAGGGGALTVVERPVSSPTYAPDVAPALIDLLDRGATGVVHVVNDGAASRLELARAVVAIAGFADRVTVDTRPEPPNTLARPAYSVLATEKLAVLIGRRLPPWDDALARYIKRLGKNS
jgi:dTDP-4-dehydrorhamnose reductase